MATPDFSPPDSFDEYRLLDRIGRGGIGQVFLAHDAMLDRHVAIKFLAAIEPGTAAHERFLVEARAAARLQHPNIVTVHRVGWLASRAYLVSEFVRGESLDRLSRPVSSQRALELGVGLARGLAAAHRRGVLHRDIKPANAIVDETGTVKLLDFGLAKLLEAEVQPVARAATTATVTQLAIDDTISFASPEIDIAGPVRDTGGITRAGTVMGTPYYMAPEAWRGDPPTRRTDVYALGALLYELCAGRPPHHGVALIDLQRVVGERAAPPLVEVAPEVDPAFARVIDRCIARDPADRPASGEEVREALEQLVPGAVGIVPEGNPYRGLSAFEAEHRALFFGRDADVRAVVERLRADPFVLVAGDSGVGKSSLCRAGVVPRVREGALGGGRDFTSASVIPGRRPLAALAAALAEIAGRPEGELHADLVRGDAAQLARALRARLGSGRGVLLFVDQLEELITLAPPDEAALFADAMAELVLPSPSLRLLATVRGDFVTRVVRLGRVGPEIGRALYLLAPLGLDGAREAIVGPARRTGVRFDPPAVVEALASSVATGDGGLPLLQFALAELWDARDVEARVIHRAALDAIGGVGGALGRHADGVLSRLLPAQREAARRVLCSLVTSEGTRARRFGEELCAGEDERAAVEALVRGRLVVARPDTQGTSYEVAHESLLQQWGTLRAWLADDVGRRATRERLAAAAAEWERLGGARDVLWRDRQLVEAAALDDDPLPARDRRFVLASRRAARRGRMLRIAAVVTLPLVAVGLWGALRLQARTALDRRVARELVQARALFQTAADLDHQLAGLRTQAFARFDAHERTAGDELWTTVLARAADVDRAYGRAAQAAETALLLDGTRHDVRGLLADAVFQRALHAETLGRVREMDEYLARLAMYDEDGGRRAAWNASARLIVNSDPAGATVSIERFDEREGQASRWLPVGAPLVTPTAPVTLERGSYRLALSAPGRASIHLPVLLARGEELRVAPALPRATQVPAGWIYVPRSRFLVGSASEESYRKGFLQTSPLHAIDGGGFLIRQHEVTYREWLVFLRALAPAERTRHAPRTATVGLQGNLELAERADGRWELRMQPSTQVYRAAEGEQIRYAKRTHNAEQDWLDFPISGISYEDAVAYAAWAGARLCTDEEWEQAARGADGRMFPHGKHMRPGDVNDVDTYQHDAEAFGPDAVGLHPASKSPYGADDMAGNVWEWVSSKGESGGRNAVRGGAYPFDINADRTEHRELAEVTLRDITIGVRVCDDVGE